MLIFQDLEASTQSARIRTGVNEMMSRFVLPIRSCEGTAIPLTLCPGHRLGCTPTGRLYHLPPRSPCSIPLIS